MRRTKKHHRTDTIRETNYDVVRWDSLAEMKCTARSNVYLFRERTTIEGSVIKIFKRTKKHNNNKITKSRRNIKLGINVAFVWDSTWWKYEERLYLTGAVMSQNYSLYLDLMWKWHRRNAFSEVKSGVDSKNLAPNMVKKPNKWRHVQDFVFRNLAPISGIWRKFRNLAKIQELGANSRNLLNFRNSGTRRQF